MELSSQAADYTIVVLAASQVQGFLCLLAAGSIMNDFYGYCCENSQY
jgi:hypothetical protein